MRYKIGTLIERPATASGYEARRGYVVRLQKDWVTVVDLSGRHHTWCLLSVYGDPTPVVVEGAKPAQVVIAERSDGYHHYGVVVGRKLAISAGCKHFAGAKTAIKHWTGRQRGDWAYDKVSLHLSHRTGKVLGRVYDRPPAVVTRARDKALNKWSRDFVRKVERLRVKN